MSKYEIMGIIDEAINNREPNFRIRGQRPEIYMAMAILDTLYELDVIDYSLYCELFEYYKNK